MPTFQILGRGKTSGRRRKRSVRVIDEPTALSMMDAEGTIVDECIELPSPPSTPELRDHLHSLGVTVADDVSLPECIFEVLRWCLAHRRCARIRYMTDLQGAPWTPIVEPHGFQRSREGFRVRCYLPPVEPEPDVVLAFQTTGWHLYLIEDIDHIEATTLTFMKRPYQRTDAGASIEFSFAPPST